MKKEIKDYGQSVRNRLLTISRQNGIPYMTILIRYIQERLLYRLSQSNFRENFFLKGGALLYAYNQEKSRPTMDIDFLGARINNDSDYIKSVFTVITSIPCVEDGILFNAETIEIEEITKDNEYHGLRLSIVASLDTIRQRVSMDIGFGDIVTPGPQTLDYPLLLESVPQVSILAYSLETVVAEKFEAMVSLSVNNSRMKDFFDVYLILNSGNVDYDVLPEAIINTFKNRNAQFIDNHPLFSTDFYSDPNRIMRWNGFLKSIKWDNYIAFETVGEVIIKQLSRYWISMKSFF